MEKVLIGLKNEMISNKKAAQPADGDMFWAARADWAQKGLGLLKLLLPFVYPFTKSKQDSYKMAKIVMRVPAILIQFSNLEIR